MNNKTPAISYCPPTAEPTSFSCRDLMIASGDEDWELPIVPDEEEIRG